MKYQGIAHKSVYKSIGGIIFLLVSLAFIRSAAGGSMESAQTLAFPPSSTSVAETADASAHVNSTNSGIAQIPIQKSSSAYRTDEEQNIKTDQIIDMGKILKFTNAESRPDFKISSQSEQSEPVPITLVGDNPSVVAGTRSTGNNDWGRYKMDSMPVSKKGSSSALANGLIVSVRMAL